MKRKIKYLLLFFISTLSLFTFSSCMKLSCETCDDLFEEEIITLTKRNKVSSNGQTLSVVATINPTYSDIKTVSWSLSWATSSSGSPENYVSLTVSSNTLTCNVAVKQGFTRQIILTCISNSNKNAKATCTIDYVGRNIDNYSDCTNAKYEIDENDMNYDKLFDMAVDNLGSNLTLGGSIKGVVKNIRLDSDGEWETDSGYTFYVEDSNEPIIDTSYYGLIMEEDGVYIPVFYDIYYNNILIKTNVYGWIYAEMA